MPDFTEKTHFSKTLNLCSFFLVYAGYVRVFPLHQRPRSLFISIYY